MTAAIKHLYARAGFGLSPDEWQQRRHWTVQAGVDQLFEDTGAFQATSVPAIDRINRRNLSEEELKREFRLVAMVNIGWIQRMADTGASSLTERMALFWHGHFACRTFNARLAAIQLNTLRRYGLGKFRDLLLAIARDVAMIRYLNNQQNRKQHPNENFARELMELFTLGQGHYSENDVKEAARAFTGWSSNPQGEYVFRPFRHDYGSKTFFGQTGPFGGEDIIDMILERRETADFITQKIYRYFVNTEIDPAVLRQLSRRFYESDYDIGDLMQHIFRSDWFYADANRGNKYKSPVELLAGLMRTLHLTVNPTLVLLPIQQSLGQVLFSPPNVAGWPGGQSWIDNSTLSLRLGLPMHILNNQALDRRPKAALKAETAEKKIGRLSVTYDLEPLRKLTAGTAEPKAFDQLVEYLLPTAPAVDLDFLHHHANRQPDPLKVLVGGLMSLPEYQLC